MVLERGTKKWVSMMLPEHRKLLSNLYKEQDYDKKPEIDEQRYEENNQILMEAIENNLLIEIRYYKNFHFHTITGYVEKCDTVRGQIQVVRESSEEIWISVNGITDIEII